MNKSQPTRLYLVGTDTSVGKTTVACSILIAAKRNNLSILPVKPAQSRNPDEISDIQRLCRFTDPPSDPTPLCFFDYQQPLAPGIAHQPQNFLPSPSAAADPTHLLEFQSRLSLLESQNPSDLTLIEGAGGLHVPMPGGTWQTQWIRSSKAWAVVIARCNLGTINHTLLTVEALRTQSIPILGIFFSDHQQTPTQLAQTNIAVIQRYADLPVFGCRPYDADDASKEDWICPLFWTQIRSLFPDTKT